MGLKDVFKKKESGHRCEMDAEGITHCQIYEKDKEGKMSTGTDFSFSVNSETGCQPVMIGASDINDADEVRKDRIIAQRVNACRKGL